MAPDGSAAVLLAESTLCQMSRRRKHSGGNGAVRALT